MGLFLRKRELAFPFRNLFLFIFRNLFLFTTVVLMLFGFFSLILEVQLFLFLFVFNFIPAGFAELCPLFLDGFLFVVRLFGVLKLFLERFAILLLAVSFVLMLIVVV